MIPKVDKAIYQKDYIIEIHFTDGVHGDINLKEELFGELFEPLKNLEFFKKFEVHPEFHTLCWPNGADFAPEFLYEKVQLTV